MQKTPSHPPLQLNKEVVVRFRSPASKPQVALGKNGIAMLGCCYAMSGGSSTMFTLGLD